MNFNKFEKTARNFYRYEGKSFRLFGKGITPNSCWRAAPKMVELVDIDIATGNDVYGKDEYHLDSGTCPIYNECVKY